MGCCETDSYDLGSVKDKTKGSWGAKGASAALDGCQMARPNKYKYILFVLHMSNFQYYDRPLLMEKQW